MKISEVTPAIVAQLEQKDQLAAELVQRLKQGAAPDLRPLLQTMRNCGDDVNIRGLLELISKHSVTFAAVALVYGKNLKLASKFLYLQSCLAMLYVSVRDIDVADDEDISPRDWNPEANPKRVLQILAENGWPDNSRIFCGYYILREYQRLSTSGVWPDTLLQSGQRIVEQQYAQAPKGSHMTQALDIVMNLSFSNCHIARDLIQISPPGVIVGLSFVILSKDFVAKLIDPAKFYVQLNTFFKTLPDYNPALTALKEQLNQKAILYSNSEQPVGRELFAQIKLADIPVSNDIGSPFEQIRLAILRNDANAFSLLSRDEEQSGSEQNRLYELIGIHSGALTVLALVYCDDIRVASVMFSLYCAFSNANFGDGVDITYQRFTRRVVVEGAVKHGALLCREYFKIAQTENWPREAIARMTPIRQRQAAESLVETAANWFRSFCECVHLRSAEFDVGMLLLLTPELARQVNDYVLDNNIFSCELAQDFGSEIRYLWQEKNVCLVSQDYGLAMKWLSETFKKVWKHEEFNLSKAEHYHKLRQTLLCNRRRHFDEQRQQYVYDDDLKIFARDLGNWSTELKESAKYYRTDDYNHDDGKGNSALTLLISQLTRAKVSAVAKFFMSTAAGTKMHLDSKGIEALDKLLQYADEPELKEGTCSIIENADVTEELDENIDKLFSTALKVWDQSGSGKGRENAEEIIKRLLELGLRINDDPEKCAHDMYAIFAVYLVGENRSSLMQHFLAHAATKYKQAYAKFDPLLGIFATVLAVDKQGKKRINLSTLDIPNMALDLSYARQKQVASDSDRVKVMAQVIKPAIKGKAINSVEAFLQLPLLAVLVDHDVDSASLQFSATHGGTLPNECTVSKETLVKLIETYTLKQLKNSPIKSLQLDAEQLAAALNTALQQDGKWLECLIKNHAQAAELAEALPQLAKVFPVGAVARLREFCSLIGKKHATKFIEYLFTYSRPSENFDSVILDIARGQGIDLAAIKINEEPLLSFLITNSLPLPKLFDYLLEKACSETLSPRIAYALCIYAAKTSRMEQAVQQKLQRIMNNRAHHGMIAEQKLAQLGGKYGFVVSASNNAFTLTSTVDSNPAMRQLMDAIRANLTANTKKNKAKGKAKKAPNLAPKQIKNKPLTIQLARHAKTQALLANAVLVNILEKNIKAQVQPQAQKTAPVSVSTPSKEFSKHSLAMIGKLVDRLAAKLAQASVTRSSSPTSYTVTITLPETAYTTGELQLHIGKHQLRQPLTVFKGQLRSRLSRLAKLDDEHTESIRLQILPHHDVSDTAWQPLFAWFDTLYVKQQADPTATPALVESNDNEVSLRSESSPEFRDDLTQVKQLFKPIFAAHGRDMPQQLFSATARKLGVNSQGRFTVHVATGFSCVNFSGITIDLYELLQNLPGIKYCPATSDTDGQRTEIMLSITNDLFQGDNQQVRETEFRKQALAHIERMRKQAYKEQIARLNATPLEILRPASAKATTSRSPAQTNWLFGFVCALYGKLACQRRLNDLLDEDAQIRALTTCKNHDPAAIERAQQRYMLCFIQLMTESQQHLHLSAQALALRNHLRHQLWRQNFAAFYEITKPLLAILHNAHNKLLLGQALAKQQKRQLSIIEARIDTELAKPTSPLTREQARNCLNAAMQQLQELATDCTSASLQLPQQRLLMLLAEQIWSVTKEFNLYTQIKNPSTSTA